MIKLKDLINEVGKLVHRINKPAVETFIKKYPKVKEVMKTLISKNKDVMKGYKAFIKFKDKNEGYLGGRAERTDSKNFGSKIFYKYDWNGIGGWAEVYEYLYDTQNESVTEGLYYVGYNKGRGQGTGVFKDSYSSYKDAKKAVEKTEKMMKGSHNMTAYYVSDKDGNFVRESVNEATTSWSKMMQGVRKGGSGPWSLVGIENKKVVAQKIDIRDKNLLPAHFEAMRKEHPRARIHIEDAGGQVVWNEKK